MCIYLYKCILYRVKTLLKQQEIRCSRYLSILPTISHQLAVCSWHAGTQRGKRIFAIGVNARESFRTLLGRWLLDSDNERSKWLSHMIFILGFFFFPSKFFQARCGRLRLSSSHADNGERLLQKACRRILEWWNLEIPGHWPEGNPHPKSRQPIRTKYFTFCSPAWTTSSAPCKPHDKVTWYARTWLVERKVEEVTWKIQKN